MSINFTTTWGEEIFLSNTLKRTSIIVDSSYNVSFTFEKLQQKDSKKLPILWILKVPRTLRFSVALRIQPHFHPMPKGDGLSRSERAVINLDFNQNKFWVLKHFYSILVSFLFPEIQLLKKYIFSMCFVGFIYMNSLYFLLY